MTPERSVIEALFHIVNKEGLDVPFRLNEAQVQIDDALTNRGLFPKARQEGVSMYFLARGLTRALGVQNTRAVIISHDTESTQRLLSRVHYFIETMEGPKPVIKTSNKNEITFPKRNSVIYIGTAGSRNFGRGDTITDLHCSEVAYWPDTKRLMTGLLQAVPRRTGFVSIESTGNGPGDWFHKACMNSMKGQSSFKLHFLPWNQFAEYETPGSPDEDRSLMNNLSEEFEEPELVSGYHLTPAQLRWRRTVLEEMDFDLVAFRREYPICLDDCFASAGSSIFWRTGFVETDEWVRVSPTLHILQGHPYPDNTYRIGADVGGGVGKDSSVAEIFCNETDEQVGEWVSNRVPPDEFGSILKGLGFQFNTAYLVVESNNHGIVTLGELRGKYPTEKLHKLAYKGEGPEPVSKLLDLGLRTTRRNKPLMIGSLRRDLAHETIIHSPLLKSELSTFIEHDDGSLGAKTGCFDDCVMAAAMANYMRDRATVVCMSPRAPAPKRKPDPNSLDSIIDRQQRDRGKYPSNIYGAW